MKAERIETVYNYDEWCRLVERHGKKILKRYICRKIRKVARFMSVVLVMYLVYALCYTKVMRSYWQSGLMIITD